MDDHAAERSVLQTTSRGRRRRLVITMYLCAGAVALVLALGGDSWWVWLAVAPLMYAYALYVRVVMPIAREMTDRKDADLDERQLAVRNRAYYLAYRILAIVSAAGLLYAMSATVLGTGGMPVPTTLGSFSLLILLFAHLAVSLPAAVVAWTEPALLSRVD